MNIIYIYTHTHIHIIYKRDKLILLGDHLKSKVLSIKLLLVAIMPAQL